MLDQDTPGAVGGPQPQPGFGLLSFSGLGIVAVKAAWENGVKAGGVSVSDPGERRSPVHFHAAPNRPATAHQT